MSRKLIRLIVAACLAIGAFAVSSAVASEEEHEFHSESETTYLTGAGSNHVLSFWNEATDEELSLFECANATIVGTLSGETSDTVRVHPEYNETENTCESTAGSMTIHTNGCDYLFESDTDANTDAPMAIDCEEGKQIEITAFLCNTRIPDQTPTGGGVSYHNEEADGERDVTMTFTMTGIAFSTEGFGCEVLGLPSEGDHATYEGTTTVKGYSDEAHEELTDFWVE